MTGPNDPQPPSARADASFACVAQDRFILFGGLNTSGTTSNAVWMWRYKQNSPGQYQWLQLSPTGTAPTARHSHATANDPKANCMYVMGGDGADDASVHMLQVTNPSSYLPAPSASWSKLLVGRMEKAPPVLVGAQMFFDDAQRSLDGVKDGTMQYTNVGRRLIVVGGRDASGNYPNKVWFLWLKDDGSKQWSSIDGPAVLGRERFGAIYDGGDGRLYLYGGLHGSADTDSVGWLDVATPSDTATQRTWNALPALDARTSGLLAVRNQSVSFERRPEVYTPGASSPWSRLAPNEQDWYPFGFTIPDVHAPGTGVRVFYPGPGVASYWLNPDDPTNTWTLSDSSRFGTQLFRGGSAAMYRIGKIMKCGTRDTESGAVAVTTTGVIDLTVATPDWTQTTTGMSVGRVNHNLVLLPTGEVFATGGTGTAVNETDIDPRLTPEIWNPDTQQWRGGVGSTELLAASTLHRGYHSTAMLLPDGRILCGGGNATPAGDHKNDRTKLELFTPPYLFDATGALATRPKLLQWPKTVKLGQWVELRTDMGVEKVVLMRAGSVTHGFNPEQRYIPLTVSGCSDLRPSVRIPADRDSVPPGDYLLFVLKQDVPAIAQWVRVTNTAFTASAAQKVTLATDCPLATDLRLKWTAPQRYFANDPCGAEYELRLREGAAVDTTNLGTSTLVVGSAPLPPGSAEQWSINDLGHSFTAGVDYYFRIRTKKTGVSTSLWSPWSASLKITASDEVECIPGTSGGSGSTGGYRAQRAFALQGAGQGVGPASNTLLGGAPDGEVVRDLMRLPTAPVGTDGKLTAWVSQQGGRSTLLKRVRLLAVDHAAGTEVVSSASGVHVGRRVPAMAVVRISPDGTGTLFDPGTTIVAAPGDELIVTLSAATTGPLLLAGDGSYEPGGEAGGFVVEVAGGSTGWTMLSRQALRAKADAVCVPRAGVTELHVRVLSTTTFAALGTLEPEGQVVVMHESIADSLSHSLDGEVTAAFASGGTGTIVSAGQRLEAFFPTPPEQTGEVREWFLDVTGVHPGTQGTGGYSRTPVLPSEPMLVFALSPGRPNPFHTGVALRLALPRAIEVLADVHDLLGRRVATLARGVRTAGMHTLTWDRRTEGGGLARAGIYMVRVRAGEHRAERKVILLP